MALRDIWPKKGNKPNYDAYMEFSDTVEQAIDDNVIGATIDEDGHLLLEQRDGSFADAGALPPGPEGPTGAPGGSDESFAEFVSDPETLTAAAVYAKTLDLIDAFVERVFVVDNYPTPGDAYAALVSAGGGVLLFRAGQTYTDIALVLDQSVPTVVSGYGATIKPPSGGTAITFAAGRSQSQMIALQGVNIDCASLNAIGVKIIDHYGAALHDVRVVSPTIGVLITDATGWTESSQLDNVYVKAPTVAGIDLQTAGGTGSFGYANWGLVHVDNVPNGCVAMRVGAGASLANSTIAQLIVHSTANGAIGMRVAGDLGYSTRIDAVIESLATTMTGSIAIDILSTGTLSGCDFNLNIITPSGGGGWATLINNPNTRPFQARTPRNRKIAAATNQAIEESGVLNEAQPMFSRSPDGTLRWGPGGSTAPDVNLTRSGNGALALNGSLQVNSGNLNPFGGMRLAGGVTTTTGGMGTGSAPATMVDASAGTITRTLYNTTTSGFVYTITKIDSSANVVNVAPPASGTINGSTSSIVLARQGDTVTVYSTPTSGAWLADATSILSRTSVATKSANYTLGHGDGTVVFTSGAAQLPAASSMPPGRSFYVKNLTGSSMTVARSGSDTIDGATSDSLASGAGQRYTTDGAVWFKV